MRPPRVGAAGARTCGACCCEDHAVRLRALSYFPSSVPPPTRPFLFPSLLPSADAPFPISLPPSLRLCVLPYFPPPPASPPPLPSSLPHSLTPSNPPSFDLSPPESLPSPGCPPRNPHPPRLSLLSNLAPPLPRWAVAIPWSSLRRGRRYRIYQVRAGGISLLSNLAPPLPRRGTASVAAAESRRDTGRRTAPGRAGQTGPGSRSPLAAGRLLWACGRFQGVAAVPAPPAGITQRSRETFEQGTSCRLPDSDGWPDSIRILLPGGGAAAAAGRRRRRDDGGVGSGGARCPEFGWGGFSGWLLPRTAGPAHHRPGRRAGIAGRR